MHSSFSLVCRQLRLRSLYVRPDQVEFRSRDHVLAFVNLLRDSPSLNSYVRSLVLQPGNVLSSFPLLHMLPRLSEVIFRQPPQGQKGSNSLPAMYQSGLTYFRRFGTHIHSLQLSDISFETPLPFFRLLLAFPNMAHLSCTDNTIGSGGDKECLDLLKRRLSEQMQLRTLTVSTWSCACRCAELKDGSL